MTNLRLPGQYDERLLGPLGLQGPYYNWNRWYLPGVGRYLEPDPIAMEGGFNGEFGPDWYGYAAGNPLRWTDPWGLKIRVKSKLKGPLKWKNPKPGKDGKASYLATWDTGGCSKRANGQWGFDVDVSLVIEILIRAGKCNVQSLEPGKTVCQHEFGHADDFLGYFQNADNVFKTEGFGSECECDDAQKKFDAEMTDYVKAGEDYSRDNRD